MLVDLKNVDLVTCERVCIGFVSWNAVVAIQIPVKFSYEERYQKYCYFPNALTRFHWIMTVRTITSREALSYRVEIMKTFKQNALKTDKRERFVMRANYIPIRNFKYSFQVIIQSNVKWRYLSFSHGLWWYCGTDTYDILTKDYLFD